MSSDKKDEEMICALTADEYGALQRGLRKLPESMPPRAVWNRIREQAEAEGLLQQPFTRKRSTWYAGTGLAAAALLAAVLLQPTVLAGGLTPRRRGTQVRRPRAKTPQARARRLGARPGAGAPGGRRPPGP